MPTFAASNPTHGVSPAKRGKRLPPKGATTPNSEFRKFRFLSNLLEMSIKKRGRFTTAPHKQ